MGGFFRIPVIRTLHERQLLLPVVLVLVVGGVLVQGALVSEAPAEASADAELVLQLPPSPVRRPNLEKTPLTYFDDYWGQLRQRVEGSVVLVGPAATPAVVVMPGLALSSADAGEAVLAEFERERLLPSQDPVAAPELEDGRGEPAGGGDAEPIDDDAAPPPDATETPAAVRPHGLIAVDRDRGLSLFEVDPARNRAFQLVPPAAVPSGAYIGAVIRDRAGRSAIIPGHLVAARADAPPAGDPSLAVSMPLSGPGAAAVVNLDGALVGVAIDRGAGQAHALLSSSVVRRIVDELQRHPPCRALAVSGLDPAALDLLGVDNGLLVEFVRQDAFLPQPSLRAGDVLLEWGGEAVTTVEEFETRSALVDPGTLVRYRILRGQRRVNGGTVWPADDCRPVADAPVQLSRHGLALRWSAGEDAPEGWRVAATAPDGPAAAAGVELGDLLLAVDGRAVDDPDDRTLFDRLEQLGGSTLLTVRRADRVRMLALIPGD